MNVKVLQRLLWKDIRTVAPLAVAAPVATLVFYAMLKFASETSASGFPDQVGFVYAIWILIPNLFAFGAPALLIGSEEESGSLAWLRTLPTEWSAVTSSKLIVGLLWLAFCWVLSTTCYLIYWETMSRQVLTWAENRAMVPDPFYLHVVGNVMFSYGLLMVSFITAYVFRSPITALMAVLPVMAPLAIGFVHLGDWMLVNGYGELDWEHLSRDQLGLIAGLGAVFLLALVCLHQWTGKRRLTAPESNLRHRIQGELSANAYRPTISDVPATWYGASIIKRKPSPRTALYWQHLRQSRTPLVLMTLAAIGAIIVMNFNRSVRGPLSWEVAVVLIGFAGGVAIPVMTFYGDTVKGRCQFFYDRGIDGALIWSTRIRITLLFASAVTVAIVIAMLMNSEGTDDILGMLSVILFGYAIGQFVSQWSTRPILAFFAAPSAMAIAALTLTGLFEFYRDWFPVLLLCSAILLYATRRLITQWMSGQKDGWRSARYAGFFLTAIIVPYFVILGTRWATLPPAETSWRNAILAKSLLPPADDGGPQIFPGAKRSLWEYSSTVTFYDGQFDGETLTFGQQMERELDATDSVAEYVNFDQLLHYSAYFPNGMPAGGYRNFFVGGNSTQEEIEQAIKQSIDSDMRVAEILVKWSNVVRERAAKGFVDFYILERCAEQADKFVMAMIRDHKRQYGSSDELEELFRGLPDRELVRESRQQALIRSWVRFDRQGYPNQFVGTSVEVPHEWWLGIERMWTHRSVDVATKLQLEQWRSAGATDPIVTSQIRQNLMDAGAWRSYGLFVTCDENDAEYQRLSVLMRQGGATP